MKKQYQPKKAGKVVSTITGMLAYATALLMPGKVQAQDNVKSLDSYLSESYSQPSMMQMARQYANEDLEDIELASAKESKQPRISGRADGSGRLEVRVNLYTANNFREFFWGISRPVHLWNKDSETDKVKVLPFYLAKDGVGGTLYGTAVATPVNLVGKAFGKDEILYNPWSDNPSLHAGQLTDIALAVAGAMAGGSGGGGEVKKQEEKKDIIYNPDNDDDDEEDDEEEKPPKQDDDDDDGHGGGTGL